MLFENVRIKCAFLEPDEDEDHDAPELFIRFSDLMIVFNMMRMNIDHEYENVESEFYSELAPRGQVVIDFLDHFIDYLVHWREDEDENE